jgi:hypothetical protein
MSLLYFTNKRSNVGLLLLMASSAANLPKVLNLRKVKLRFAVNYILACHAELVSASIFAKRGCVGQFMSCPYLDDVHFQFNGCIAAVIASEWHTFTLTHNS